MTSNSLRESFTLMVLKSFLNNDNTKSFKFFMALRRFHSGGTKKFFNDGTKRVPQ